MLKVNPYAKYMKDIITNKRKIPEAEISTMLANYTFKGGIPKKLGDPGVPTIPCSIKRNYVKIALCDLGAGVSVMHLPLYRRLELNKCRGNEHLWGRAPFRSSGGRRPHEERIEAEHASDFYPASELSGEIILLLLLCGCIELLLESVSVLWF